MKFAAIIDGVHFDPKKGSVKIVLICTSHVSLDELTTVAPKDESIHVTFESEQTKIGNIRPKNAIEPKDRDVGLLIELDGERAAILKDAADQLNDASVDGDEGEEGDHKQWPQYKPGGEDENAAEGWKRVLKMNSTLTKKVVRVILLVAAGASGYIIGVLVWQMISVKYNPDNHSVAIHGGII